MSANEVVEPTAWDLISVGEALAALKKSVQDQSAPVTELETLLGVWLLVDGKANLVPMYKRAKDLYDRMLKMSSSTLDFVSYMELREIADPLRESLANWMPGIPLCPLQRGKHFETLLLMQEVQETIKDKDVLRFLPSRVIDDLIESRRCLNLRSPVGAAMLSFHAVEYLVMRYYDVVGAEPKRSTKHTFSRVVKNLRNWKDLCKPLPALLGKLVRIADYASEIDQMERSNIVDAEFFFLRCSGCLSTIVMDLARIEKIKGLDEFELRKKLGGLPVDEP